MVSGYGPPTPFHATFTPNCESVPKKKGRTSPGSGNANSRFFHPSHPLPACELALGTLERERPESKVVIVPGSSIGTPLVSYSFAIVSAASPPENVWSTPKKKRPTPPPEPILEEKLAMTGGAFPPSNEGSTTLSLREILISAVGGLASKSKPAFDLVMNTAVLKPTHPVSSINNSISINVGMNSFVF